MTHSLADVQELALSLDEKDRASLVDALVTSLAQPTLSDIEKSWLEEVDRRYKAYKEGKVSLIPADEVFAKIDKEFGW